MDELEKIVKQIEILNQTISTMIQRSEQLFKMQEEKSATLIETANKLTIIIEALQVTDEALKRSLSESDAQIDDLAKVTAALLQIQQSQSQAAETAQ